MSYPFHLLENVKILVSVQDLETFIRQVLGRSLFIVEKLNLDETNRRFELHFWQRHLGLDRYMEDGEIGKVYWGGVEIIEWSNSTEIVRMWAADPEDWYIGEFGLNKDKEMEERFEWLENLSNEIRERFDTLSTEVKYNSEPITTTKNDSELTLKQLDSIVQNTLFIFQGFDIERLEEGSNIFYTVFADVEKEKVLLGKYRVWERHDGGVRSGWRPSNNHDPKILKLRDAVWQTIISTAVNAKNNKVISTEQPANKGKLKGGRPRNVDDDWAYEQVRTLGRDKQTVFNEWLERIGERKTLLSNPKDSFNKAVSPKRGKRN